MKIIRSISRDGNVFPPVFNYLKDLPDVVLHHQEHSLRHPLAIYNKSITRVANAFISVLNQINKLEEVPLTLSETGNVHLNLDPTELLKEQKELLDALMSHIDDCYHILKALHPFSERREHFADRWLEQVKHPTVGEFKHLIKPYRDSFAPIDNAIKHQHGELNSVTFYDQNDRIFGYYLTGADKKGIVGPDPNIHPRNTAISFNYDLRYHFVHLYIVGLRLQQAIVKAVKKMYNIDLLPSTILVEDSSKIMSVAEKIFMLRLLFFSDEVSKLTPLVVYEEKDNDKELKLEYPASIRASGPIRMQVHAQFSGDGVTKEFRIPYLGMSA